MLRALLPAALLLSLAAAGCLEGQDLTPEERAVRAAERFQQGLGPAGDVRRVHGAADAEGMRVELDLTLGEAGSGRFQVALGGLFSMTYLCTKDRAFLTMGGETREMRPEGQCADSLLAPEDIFGAQGDAPPSPVNALANATVVEARDESGLLTATYRPDNASMPDMLLTATFDSQDRIRAMRIESPEGTADFTVEYGERRALPLPTPDRRLPSAVRGHESWTPGALTWNGMTGDGAPLAEFEVRVIDREGRNVTAFPLTTSEATAEGFTFTFRDDGDGALGAGDRFTLANAAWTERHDYEVQVYDAWAQADVKDRDVPALGILGLLAALGLALVAVRRR